MTDPIPGATHSRPETILAECLAASKSEWSNAVGDACNRHPALATELRRLYDNVQSLDALLTGAVTGTAPASPLGPGAVLGGYELMERVGGGGMGIVFRARQRSLDRVVALKLIRPDVLRVEKARERFRRETEAIARLHHPGIVPLFESGEDLGIPFFTMEFIEGHSLGAVLNALRFRQPARLRSSDFVAAYRQLSPSASAEDGVFSALEHRSWPALCCRIIARAARALDHAHANGIVHRDVKPSNMMITDLGRVVIVDFGLAVTEGAPSLTRSGSQPGSLPYMSPEQLEGRALGGATDVYSLGVTLYELLTLRCPFPLTNPDLARKLITAGDFERPRARNRGIAPEIEAVCLKAMDRDPARRYSSATAFADDLVAAALNRPIAAKTFHLPRRLFRFAKRHPSRTLAAIGLFLALVVSPLVFAVMTHRHAKEIEAQRVAAQASESIAIGAQAEAETVTEFIIGLIPPPSDSGPTELLRNAVARRAQSALQSLDGASPTARARLMLSVAELLDNLDFPKESYDIATAGALLVERELGWTHWLRVGFAALRVNKLSPSEGIVIAREAVQVAERCDPRRRLRMSIIAHYALARQALRAGDYITAEQSCRLALSRIDIDQRSWSGSTEAGPVRQNDRLGIEEVLMHVLLLSGRIGEARNTALAALSRARQLPRHDEACELGFISCLHDIAISQSPDLSGNWADEAMALARRNSERPILRLRATIMQVKTMIALGQAAGAVGLLDDTLADARNLTGADSDTVYGVLALQAYALEQRGNLEEAESIATQVLNRYNATRLNALTVGQALLRGRVRLARGDFRGAANDCEPILQESAQRKSHLEAGMICATAMLGLGEASRAEALALACVRDARARGAVENDYAVHLLSIVAKARIQASDDAAASRIVASSLELCAGTDDKALLRRAVLFRGVGDVRLAIGDVGGARVARGEALAATLCAPSCPDRIARRDARSAVVGSLADWAVNGRDPRQDIRELIAAVDLDGPDAADPVFRSWIAAAAGIAEEVRSVVVDDLQRSAAVDMSIIDRAVLCVLVAESAAARGDWHVAAEGAAAARSLARGFVPRVTWIEHAASYIATTAAAMDGDPGAAQRYFDEIPASARSGSVVTRWLQALRTRAADDLRRM